MEHSPCPISKQKQGRTSKLNYTPNLGQLKNRTMLPEDDSGI